MDDQTLPSDDPDLAEVWPQMSETERLRYQLAEQDPVPEKVSDAARRAYTDRG